ncbi:hypothetical protein RF55_8719 [Lasius niger]|uniref:Uncharacterized protein n=1 Tax=Lasius niger TaxID=67767 RepID=A0A0J7NFS7_LASNI|nr:hypothetical protein RF55_8719 [Lasius niger]
MKLTVTLEKVKKQIEIELMFKLYDETHDTDKLTKDTETQSTHDTNKDRTKEPKDNIQNVAHGEIEKAISKTHDTDKLTKDTETQSTHDTNKNRTKEPKDNIQNVAQEGKIEPINITENDVAQGVREILSHQPVVDIAIDCLIKHFLPNNLRHFENWTNVEFVYFIE